MKRIDKSQTFQIEYDSLLDKWIVWANKGSLKIQVGSIGQKQVGIWLNKINKIEKENK